MEKHWESKWEKINRLGSGGQGNTFLVKSKKGGSEEYVLKILKKANSKNRLRMQREVASLKSLKYKGVPEIIEDNCGFYNDETIPLYIVYKFMPGSTLDKFIQDNRINFNESLEFIIRITKIIDYCHFNNIIHRDIKPNNIVLYNNNINDPYLIDFGLSFNSSEIENNDITFTDEQVGNRFLSLPEQKIPNEDKRDARSDITFICGLFYFILTSTQPTMLMDPHGKKPHQRYSKSNKINTLFTDESQKLLLNLFDIGFNNNINERWQSVEQLHYKLLELKYCSKKINLTKFVQKNIYFFIIPIILILIYLFINDFKDFLYKNYYYYTKNNFSIIIKNPFNKSILNTSEVNIDGFLVNNLTNPKEIRTWIEGADTRNVSVDTRIENSTNKLLAWSTKLDMSSYQNGNYIINAQAINVSNVLSEISSVEIQLKKPFYLIEYSPANNTILNDTDETFLYFTFNNPLNKEKTITYLRILHNNSYNQLYPNQVEFTNNDRTAIINLKKIKELYKKTMSFEVHLGHKDIPLEDIYHNILTPQILKYKIK